ncbi:MAG: zinc-ribbon domain-containing protein [Bradymonadia bacterium]
MTILQSLFSFQVLALLSGLVTVYLIYQAIKPLLDTTRVTVDDLQAVEDESMALLTQRDRLVDELKELEFEAALNKIGARDLKQLKAKYEREAMAVYERIDAASEAYQDRIDADVNTRLKGKQKAEAPEAAPEQVKLEKKAPEPETAAAEPQAEEPVVPQAQTKTCWSCGGERDVEGEFCDLCGAPSEPPQVISCAACGTENRPGARFCKRCGTDLQSVEANA